MFKVYKHYSKIQFVINTTSPIVVVVAVADVVTFFICCFFAAVATLSYTLSHEICRRFKFLYIIYVFPYSVYIFLTVNSLARQTVKCVSNGNIYKAYLVATISVLSLVN